MVGKFAYPGIVIGVTTVILGGLHWTVLAGSPVPPATDSEFQWEADRTWYVPKSVAAPRPSPPIQQLSFQNSVELKKSSAPWPVQKQEDPLDFTDTLQKPKSATNSADVAFWNSLEVDSGVWQASASVIEAESLSSTSIRLPPIDDAAAGTEEPRTLDEESAKVALPVQTGDEPVPAGETSVQVEDAATKLEETPAPPFPDDIPADPEELLVNGTSEPTFDGLLLAAEPLPEPTPARAVPPSPIEEVTSDNTIIHPDPLFQKRYDILNRSMNSIDLSLPKDPGVQPVDIAAVHEAGTPPILLGGEDGWFEQPINRYPVPFAYQPLYYEEINLERCGVGHGCLQPLFSSAAFVKNTITLPYYLFATPPRSMVQTPGDCPSCYQFQRTCR
ncbi:hypothetical protein SH661x_003191 [Planctomicrobium sp. SH661]|uniref:hypothetical protein n=1 Tax=Planctomicrobium sp. SH661 TaxID=3448124 RepID=UPI003F5C7B8A